MVKGTVQTEDTPKRPRKKSQADKSERRNSVSEITEYFQSNMANPNVKGKVLRSAKDKDKDKENKGNKDSPKVLEDLNKKQGATGVDLDALGGSNLSVNAAMCDSHDKDQENAREEPLTEESLISQDNSTIKEMQVEVATQTSEDAILEIVKALEKQVVKLDADINEPKNGISVQLAKTSMKTQDLYSDIHGKVNGLLIRLDKVSQKTENINTKVEQMEASQKRITSLLEENKRLMQELQLMQGLVQKLSQQSHNNSNQILDLTRRGMEQNVIIYGVDDAIEKADSKRKQPQFTFKERMKHDTLTFLREVMKLDLSLEDIWKAHRIGQYKPDRVRPMVVKLSYAAKELVMENISSLKGLKNPNTEQVYFISEQVPEGILETKKQTAARVKVLRDANESKPEHQKDKIQVINDKVLINGEVDIPLVMPPQPSQLFLDVTTQRRVDELQSKMVETDPMTVRNSEFRALAIKVHSIQEMNDAYIAASQRFPTADHIMAAYAFKENQKLVHGSCDDKEYGAAIKIKNVLFENHAKNTAIFVIRKYGGIHLGIERFKSIITVAQQALELMQ